MTEGIPVSELPTLSALYKAKLFDPTNDEPLYKPSAVYNDKISVIRQDITTLAVDSIVNAANNTLLGGGGVDGAIHRAAGRQLVRECETLDGCATGSAKITDGYRLPAKKVIHAVGPIYWKTKAQGKHSELLSGCYRTSLDIAVRHGLKSIAFPALSTGIYGYPSREASEVALETVRKFLDEGRGVDMERIIFCNFLEKDEDAYFMNIPKYFPPAPTAAEENLAETSGEKPEEKPTGEPEPASKLPEDPSAEPKNAKEPTTEKQKAGEAEDDFVIVDKEDAKDATTKADL